MGDIMHYFDSEKPALRQQIQAEFDKNVNIKPSPPTKWQVNLKGQKNNA